MEEKEKIIITTTLRISESNYKYINKKALELGVSQNALINLLISLGSKVIDCEKIEIS